MPAAPDSSNDRPAGLVLRGGTILTLDTEATVLSGADLLIEDGRIRRIGGSLEGVEAARTLDVTGHLVLPGLVQGHVHLGQTIFRGLAEGRRLLPWLRERIWPLEAGHDDESAYWGSLLGAAECLLGGTTTIQDIGLGPGAAGLQRAFVESGLRGLVGRCLMDEGDGLPPALAGDTDNVLASCEELGLDLGASGGDRVRYVLNPRFILSCSDELWRGIRELSGRHDWPVHTHALEQKEESAAVAKLKNGRGEIDYFDDAGILAGDLRIAHGVWLAGQDLPRLARRRFSVVHCPSSNLKLGSGVADVVGIRAAGIPVGLGADGAPCNNDLDILEEVRLAALLQQLENGPGTFSGLEALRLATSEGARAIGLQHEIGSVEVGKAADLVVLALDRPELWAGPTVDPHDLVVYGAARSSVRHVVVAGEVLVEDGRLTRLDLDELRRRASRALEAVVRRSGLDLG
jgi:cytosine/adenosine deaminase-related metal-dependent hydrolase